MGNRLLTKKEFDERIAEAVIKANLGIKNSAQHAENDVPGWGEMALTMVRWFAKVKDRQWSDDIAKGRCVPRHVYAWTAEECRLWASAHDLPDPPELRAWGSVIQRALREGLIVKAGGYRTTAASNGSARALYRKA